MKSQLQPSTCPKCRSTIVLAELPGGLCPQCALAAALVLDSSDEAARSLSLRDIAPPKRPTDRIGDYELLEVIAQGGMGVVYKARQRSLNRIVALKLLLGGAHAGLEFKKRFRQEAETVAKLRHPNIVPIYEVGEHDRQPYFSMEYVAGKDFSRLTRPHPMPVKPAANYVRIVSEAMAYAHQQGVLHRDLKPSNILLGMDDRPRITDFGLARQLDADSSLTTSGALLGTPGYLPPEQVSLKRGEVGMASDVYALGGVLYCLLTSRPPFVADNLGDMLQDVLNREPQSPRALNPKVPRDLETICLKCLRKEPSQRYPSAQDLADDLGRFLQSEPIRARNVATHERLAKWCCRRPALAGLGAALVLLAVAGWNWKRLGSQISGVRLEAEQQATVGRLADAEAKRERVKRDLLQEFARVKQQEAEQSRRQVEEANQQLRNKSFQAQPSIPAGVAPADSPPVQTIEVSRLHSEFRRPAADMVKVTEATPTPFSNYSNLIPPTGGLAWRGNLPVNPEHILPATAFPLPPGGSVDPIIIRKLNKRDPLPLPLPDPKALVEEIKKRVHSNEDPRLPVNEFAHAQQAYYLSALGDLNTGRQSFSLSFTEQFPNQTMTDSNSDPEQQIHPATTNTEVAPATTGDSTDTSTARSKDGRGVVTRVSDNLIWVSLGADDGLVKGDKVKIYLPRGTSQTNYLEVAEIRLGIVDKNESMGASTKPMNVGWPVVRSGLEIK